MQGSTARIVANGPDRGAGISLPEIERAQASFNRNLSLLVEAFDGVLMQSPSSPPLGALGIEAGSCTPSRLPLREQGATRANSSTWPSQLLPRFGRSSLQNWRLRRYRDNLAGKRRGTRLTLVGRDQP